jgi:hypothetical protein
MVTMAPHFTHLNLSRNTVDHAQLRMVCFFLCDEDGE